MSGKFTFDITVRPRFYIFNEFYQNDPFRPYFFRPCPIFPILNRIDVNTTTWRFISKKFNLPPFPQAFALLSDKLTPLVDGVRNNKANWLQLAQNVQNYTHRKPPHHNNNNVSADDDSNGGSDTPKIVGKFGKFNSHYNLFYHKQNGSILTSSGNCPVADSMAVVIPGVGGSVVSDNSETTDEAMD